MPARGKRPTSVCAVRLLMALNRPSYGQPNSVENDPTRTSEFIQVGSDDLTCVLASHNWDNLMSYRLDCKTAVELASPTTRYCPPRKFPEWRLQKAASAFAA